MKKIYLFLILGLVIIPLQSNARTQQEINNTPYDQLTPAERDSIPYDTLSPDRNEPPVVSGNGSSNTNTFTGTSGSSNTNQFNGGNGSGSSGTCQGADTKLCNPLKVKSLAELLKAVLKIIVEIGTVVSVFMIIYAGFLFVKSQGNPTEIAKAKSAFYTAIIGMVILLGAQAIATVITSTVNQLQ